MARSLALELAPIRVNAVSPGAVLTPLFDNMGKEQKETLLAIFKDKCTTGEIGKPEDVAESYLYVMRDANISGSVIDTDGGHLLTA